MTHPKSERLSEYLDGLSTPEVMEELEAHLSECRSCQALLEDLEEIREMARELSPHHPPRDLWPEISRAIRRDPGGDPEVIRLYPSGDRLDGSGRTVFRVSPLQAVAAGLVLAVISGALGLQVGSRRTQESVPGQEMEALWVSQVGQASPQLETVARNVAELERLLNQRRGDMEEETALVLERNLEVIDGAIRESVAALRADPENQFLEDHLERTILAKAEYLRSAAALMAPVG